jgi:hypothetical protein
VTHLPWTLFIIMISVIFGGSPSFGEEPLEIIPAPVFESRPPLRKIDSLEEEAAAAEAAAAATPTAAPSPEPEKTTDVYVAPAPTPSPLRNKLDDSIGREHDLWDPDFLLAPEPEAEEKEDATKGYLERSYFGISRRVVHLANSVDSIFGDRRATDEYDGSTLRFTQGATFSENSFSTNDLSLSLNLQLPNLQSMEKRVRQTISQDIVGNQVADDEETAQDLFKKENSTWDFNQESGIRTRWPPSYFSQVRARRNFLTVAVVHHFLLQLGWDSEAEWEQKTQVTSDYAISKGLLFRFLNEANWAMTNHIFGTVQGPSLVQQIDDSSAVSYDARILTNWEGDNWYINDYTLGSTYRKALSGRRIFIEFKPELSWPKTDSHEFNWNVYINFELLFGRAS